MLCMAEKEGLEFPRAIQEVSGKGGVEGRTQQDVGKTKGSDKETQFPCWCDQTTRMPFRWKYVWLPWDFL